MIPQSEIDHLADLFKDFSTGNHYTPEVAFNLIRTSFRSIEKSNFIPEICKDLKSIKITDYPNFFKKFAEIIHEYIYKDILVNAGEYRKSSDPGGGVIYFGGPKQRSMESKFKGISPENIKEKISKAFSWLGNDGNPVENVLRFYQHFVYIHPFYDANGRIARIIMIIYLLINKLTINREPFDQSKGKFMKKLNRCHERFGTDKFEKYFKYFYQFMQKYIIPIEINENEC